MPIRKPQKLLAHLIAGTFVLPLSSQAASLALSQTPLFLSSSQKANVLLLLDNSNSMDESANGAAVGSSSANSKSEIARSVARSLVDTYLGKINMGLMAYQQNTPLSYHLHNAPYDISYNSGNYDAGFSGARNSPTKAFQAPNPSDSGNSFYYNVALPFYASTNQGNAFCYGPTAIAFNNGENPGSGPWDSYRCFSTKTGSNDGVVSPLPGGGIKAAETALGYSGLIGTYTFSPTDSDLAQGILDFGKLMAWTYVGKTWFANVSPGKGYLHTPVAALTATQATTLKSKLACNIPGTPSPCATTGLQNAGLTPIEGSLLTAKDYFGGSLSATAQGGPLAAPPNSCGKDFVVLLTDGLPSTDKNGNIVTNPDTALAAAASAADQLRTAGSKTYVVGFALPYGFSASQLNTIAASGGTGTAYAATDLGSLTSTLGDIFSDILAQTGSAAAVATNSTSLVADSAIFQAKFDSADWSGRLFSYDLGSDGSIAGTPSWMAGSADSPAPAYYVALPAASSRSIITAKTSTGTGIPFRWPVDTAAPTATELDASQTATLGSSAVLNYLRGDASNEGSSAGQYRPRPAGKLGDIVNSSPVYVVKPKLGYPDSFEGSAYSAFSTTYASRTPMLYVGANDGMLHAFEASTGKEKLAYIPNAVFSKLANLTSNAYTHRFYVDGTPTMADAYYDDAWHTLLVGGLNAGGQGIYTLDITDPANFSEANASSIVRWEFTDNNDADLGYTFSQPAIGRMANGKWAAIFGNGYNNTDADGHASTTGQAYLYVVDLQTGTLLAKLATKAGSTTTPNGLASPKAIDVDGDNIVDYVFAGDLQGNLWKFDLTAANASAWKVAYGTPASPQPLFTAKDTSGATQPITTKPAVGLHPTRGSGYLVYFGTGKYLETGDNGTTGTQTQTFYGIWDNDAAVSGRSVLQPQTILGGFTESGAEWRTVSQNNVDWSTKKGWYLDLESAEKQVSDPILRNGRIIFTTLTPSSGTCAAGGYSWLMELDARTGGALDSTPFDVNGDGYFSADDFRTTSGSTGSDARAVGGTKLGDGIAGKPTIVNGGDKQHKYFSKSSGSLQELPESTDGNAGRISWRELIKSR